MDEVRPLLELTGATVRFGVDAALNNVSFRLFPGEVHSLMGENGAGKSTLIKAITGVLPLNEGELRLDGELVTFATPYEAQRAGISTVYQEVELLPNLSVAENIGLGREQRRGGVISAKRMQAHAREILAELGLDIDPASTLGTHSLAVQQLVSIARALSVDVKVLVLDEPTSSLDLDEVAELFRIIRELKSRGVAILFVSHFLDQVYEVCDRLTVLRDGEFVGSTSRTSCCGSTWSRRCSAARPPSTALATASRPPSRRPPWSCTRAGSRAATASGTRTSTWARARCWASRDCWARGARRSPVP
ncbi:hypothetical protein GCM10025873_14710 [Demequina sediminis]|uniref:ATP-binding cassette domain-containing protein n=1 Tax=Demequina sediminis TaxID=1930058 RepID=UPI002572C3A3|nr:ATP-binding cassette domain-containing protein [Demequina sediminis]BDZ61680.1 hypothetical protein GCM10025873_14710 [Demequina sediminis]